MFIILAAVAFGLAFFFHGGQVTIASHWFDVEGLTLIGLFFLALGAWGPAISFHRKPK